jgi:protein-tyrosine-phosphatase/predicted ATP-grasp superfamily ATP-dependent carboligase
VPKSTPSGKVLVLGSDFKNYRSCLTIIRSLGRQKLEVHAGWVLPGDLLLKSKYVARVHDIHPFTPEDDSWKQKLLDLIVSENFDLVIPGNEQASAPLEKNRADFAQFPAVYLLNEKAYDIAFDKFKTIELARSLEINLPDELRVSDLSRIDEIIARFKFPIVLKPCISFRLEDLSRKHYVYKAYNQKELKTTLRYLLKDGDVLVQENFIGTGVGVEFLADQGKLLYTFQHIRIHEPLMGGGSSYRKSAPVHPELLDATARIVKALDYSGVGMTEFKYNFATDQWVFLEINGRFWGSLPLAINSGADFPYFLYQLKVENKQEFPQPYNTDLYCRNTLRDFIWIIDNITADKSDRSKNTLPNWRVAKEIFNILLLKEKNDTRAIDDLSPGITEIYRLIRLALGKAKTLCLNYSPARFIRTWRTRKALARAETVLFVCFGNIYRSPFAENYAKKIMPQAKTINSAGYYPKESRRCHQRAVDIGAEFEVDISEHLSRVVDDKAVADADIIFVFDKDNRRNLITMFPTAKNKIRYLGLLSYRTPVIIDDPVNGNLYTVRETYRIIKKAIDSGAGSQ